MKFLHKITYLIIIVALNSCASMKPAVSERQTLSNKFGVTITKRDNIKLYREASSWLGVKYKLGGTTKRGVDCSGFVDAIYKDVYGKKLNRTVDDIYHKDCRRIRQRKLKEGDLVFFRTGENQRKNKPNHVGVYLKDDRFVHASTSKGVEVNTLSNVYYKKTFVKVGRVTR